MYVITFIYGILILIQGFFLGWLWRLFIKQKDLIEDQSAIIHSYKGQSGCLKEIQEVISNLIKPDFIQNTVQLHVSELNHFQILI